jgi:type IV secretion system protein VirB11
VKAGILTPEQKDFLCAAVRDHRNILVTGSTGSGKTTFVNSLIGESTTQFPSERLIIVEDTGELQCAAANYVQYHTSPECDMTNLVRTTLRMRPDRILVGEVRGPEALDLLMAWNTGHEGGIATVHANNAVAGLARMVTLVSMNPKAPRSIEPLIGEAVDVVVHIERKEGGAGRIVREVLVVEKWDATREEYVFRGLT